MISAHHAGYVVDASVLVKWFLHQQEADRERALALRDLHISGRSTIYIPQLALLEVLNASGLSKGRGRRRRDGFRSTPGSKSRNKTTEFNLLRKANAIAWAYKTTIYDALYVALAEQVGYPLITADEEMVKKLKGHSIVVPLRELAY